MSLSQRFASPLKRAYGRVTYGRTRWRDIIRRIDIRTVDLRRILMGGEGPFDAGPWAELTKEPARASMLVSESPHVRLLEEYAALGERLFDWKHLRRTAYFQNAARAVEFCGSYFGHRTHEGIAEQVRAFVGLYQRMLRGDPGEVRFTNPGAHSPAGSLPAVRETLTRNTFQVSDGHHRLAVAWMLGRREVRAAVVGPPSATALQSLVLSHAQTQGRRELYQPINSVEFDGTWNVVRQCDDRLALMRSFLASMGRPLERMSVLDVGCAYGWFVGQFSQGGASATGVDTDAAALRAGQIAYGLRRDQLVESDAMTFLAACGRKWDVVLLLSLLHHFVLGRNRATAEELLAQIDRVTGTCLFLDTGQSHERWWRGALPGWTGDAVAAFVRRHTSFSQVVPLGTDRDYAGRYRANYGRTLFACVRRQNPL
jgi:SAM-dependent methyltransferase